jgi:hypothetical protein
MNWQFLPIGILSIIFGCLNIKNYFCLNICKHWKSVKVSYHELTIPETYSHKFIQTLIKTVYLSKIYSLSCESIDIFPDFTNFINVSELNISKSLTDDDFKSLICLNKLRSLNLKKCANLTSYSLYYLNFFPHLNELVLLYKRVTDQDLYFISKLKLTKLVLNKCYDITDDGIKYIILLNNLQYLVLDDLNDVSENGFKYICMLTKLSTFKTNLILNDKCMNYICKMINLEELDICNDHISYISLLNLHNLTKLQSLSLISFFKPKIFTNQLPYFLYLLNLKKLDLCFVDIINEDIDLLIQMKLTELNLRLTNVLQNLSKESWYKLLHSEYPKSIITFRSDLIDTYINDNSNIYSEKITNSVIRIIKK